MLKRATRIAVPCVFLACTSAPCSAASTWEVLSGTGCGRVIYENL